LRIAGKKDRLMTLKQIISDWNDGEGIPTVKDFRQAIDEASADLGRALFDKRECGTCAKNSETQRNLFGIGDDSARCLDSRCYLAKQKEWLTGNWQEHVKALDPELAVNGIRFGDELSRSDWEPFYYRTVPERCMTCENFVTILTPTGGISHQHACCGAGECRQETLYGGRANHGATQSAGPAASAEGADPGGPGTQIESEAPVKAWHGEFFREEFFKLRIPEKAKELDPFDDKMIRLALFAIVVSNAHIHPWFAERLNLPRKPRVDYGFFLHCQDILPVVQSLDSARVPALLHEATIQVLLNNRTVMANTRRSAARFLGIDLSAEWRITKEYLENKTKSEIVSIINRFKLLDQPEAWKFAGESYGLKAKSAVGRLKKKQMAGIIIDSGIDLAGIVPAEILHDSEGPRVGYPQIRLAVQAQSTPESPEEKEAPSDFLSFSPTDGGESHPFPSLPDDFHQGSPEVDLGCTFDPEEEETTDAVH
jgi:hypothetical protein